ncbi:MAG: magnesium chelatase subunit D [Steroidobacteraceae bacterium]|nr:magnesium chelatase subunit D [Steroidobacteraceae bacterium]
MTEQDPQSPGPAAWSDAVLAAALVAVDPAGLGGVCVRAPAGPVRDTWLELLREFLPPGTPLRRVPLHAGDERLLGGLDLAATLGAGRPVAERGLIAEADGGVLLLPMAERITAGAAARITAALDAGEVLVERDGLALRIPARVGVVAFDEGAEADERPPPALIERLAFAVDLDPVSTRDVADEGPPPEAVHAARRRLRDVRSTDAVCEALCTAAQALGIGSLRAPWFALRAARAAAALAGRDEVAEADAALAARLVFSPRATLLPAPEEAPEAPEPPPEAPEPENESSTTPDRPLEDVVLEAALAALPPELLARLRQGLAPRSRAQGQGRAGAVQKSRLRGRPAGTRAGEPRAGARLNLVETLRAAAPWQPLRRRQAGADARRVLVRRDDFRITRFKQRSPSTTLFAVDASGSAALHRLAEAKGAVELLLADCYVRRDQVALLAFRGTGAEMLLPPTRSLTRARRCLAALPGGGGTPLAAGLDLALELALNLERRGESVTLVVLTDGRANIARDGQPGRPRAAEDALAAARLLRGRPLASLVVDTAPRPEPFAQRLAAEMGAVYLPLPHADAARLTRAVQSARPSGT